MYRVVLPCMNLEGCVLDVIAPLLPSLLSTTSHPLPPTSTSHLCLPPLSPTSSSHLPPPPPSLQVLRKGGMNPGDAIIITKGVGTGTILAADMRVEADAAWMSYV